MRHHGRTAWRFGVIVGAVVLAVQLAVAGSAAATPNVGQHIHVEIANHPLDGSPIPRAPYTFRVTIKAHDNRSTITSFRVSDYSDVIRTISDFNPAVPGEQHLGPCADCTITFDFTVDFATWSTGRHELRWTANEPDADPDQTGNQRQFTTSRSQVCLASCTPNVSDRATPFNGAGSWYEGHDYATVYVVSADSQWRPGGRVTIRAAQDADHVCAFLAPDFHHGSAGTTLLPCVASTSNQTFTVPASAPIGAALVVIAHDGFNAGVFRMPLGDGSPRASALMEYQSWWAKAGLVFPPDGNAPTPTATPTGGPTATPTITPGVPTPTPTIVPTATPVPTPTPCGS